MAAPPQERVRKRLVWFSPFFLVVALSPAFLQITCDRGDTHLSNLQVEVSGHDQIVGFAPATRYYDVATSGDTVVVRAETRDATSSSYYQLRAGGALIEAGALGVGGGEVTLSIPLGQSTLKIDVRPTQGGFGAYSIDVVRFPEFPCTEQGILDAIAFGGGPHFFACNGPTTVTTLDEIFIYNDVILDGEGNLIVQGSQEWPTGYHRVFSVLAGVTAELSGMTITGGGLYFAPGGTYGAGIFNEGTLTVSNSSIVGNKQVYGADFDLDWRNNLSGAGIYSAAQLTLDNTTVSGNECWGSGAGVFSTGELVVTDSVISDNSAQYGANGMGGGIYNAGSLTMANSRVVQNDSQTVGGGIRNDSGTMTLLNSTLSANYADSGGIGIDSSAGTILLMSSTVSYNWGADSAGIWVSSSGTITIVNTTVRENEELQIWVSGLSGPTVTHSTVVGQYTFGGGVGARVGHSIVSGSAWWNGSVISDGYNIESPGNTHGFTDPTDQVNVTVAELNLGPLQDNGGPTETHALLPGSVAIDRIPEAECVDAGGAPLTTDQRGVARPQGVACDVGAFEWADCSGSVCDDGNDCTVDYCDPPDYSWCVNNALPDGTLCGVDGVCEAGVCRSWGTPVLIETGAGDAYGPEIAVDANGNATAVWQQYNGAYWDIWANRYTAGVGWNTAVVIDGAAGDAYGQEVAVDANGNATAVWRQYGGTDWNIWANRYTPGVGWGAAVLIENGAGEAYDPEIAVDPNGNATAVWQQYNGADWDIWANRYTAGVGWGTGLLLDSAAGEANGPEIAVDANGNATAVWQQYNGVDWDIWSNRYTTGIGWGTAVLIESAAGEAYDARLAIDPNGNAIAVWQQYDGVDWDIWSNRYTTGIGWGTPVVIDSAAGEAKDPQVAVDPDGNAAAVWRQYNGASHDIWSNHYTPGIGWGTAVLIETAAGEAYDPEIVLDPDGNATVVWEQKNGTDWDIWSNRYTPGVGWGAAVLIQSATGSFGGGAPQVAVDPSGNATAAWTAGSSVWSNRFE